VQQPPPLKTVLSGMTSDDSFKLFCAHWKSKSPRFHLDDPVVQEKLMSLISCCMVMLDQCPAAFHEFIRSADQVAEQAVPESAKAVVDELAAKSKD
jgi:hypothetical protein